MIDPKKLIVFDADVIIHFDKADRLYDLRQIFPSNKKFILDKVLNELKTNSLRQAIDHLITFNVLEVQPFPNDKNIIIEYARLNKTRGAGESACMAYCKYTKNIIASSNLKDIKQYCTEHEIQYLTTMDFVYEAFKAGTWNNQDCEDFVKDVLTKGSKLPYQSFAAYLEGKK
jgi:hypothetical protein